MSPIPHPTVSKVEKLLALAEGSSNFNEKQTATHIASTICERENILVFYDRLWNLNMYCIHINLMTVMMSKIEQLKRENAQDTTGK